MLRHCVFLIIAIALLGTAYAEVVSSGPCPNDIQVVPDYQVEKYVGVWYEFARYPSTFEKNGKCNIAFYSPIGDNRVGVYNSMTNNKTGNLDYIVGYAEPVANAKLKVVFPGTPTAAASNYWVLDTDYITYSCVYSSYAWTLTRDKFPKTETIQKCEDVFTRNKLSLKPLVQTVQTDC